MKFEFYTFQARLMPAYLTLLPLAVGLQTWLPDSAFLERLGTVLVAPAPFALLLAHLGRDRGYRLQEKLWTEWGGALTTQLLRHRNLDFNPVKRRLYHMHIKKLFPDLHMPSPNEEKDDPGAADHSYEAATRMLISATQDRSRFPLVYKENVNYGFRRNLWGLRPYGLVLSIVAVLICLTRFLVSEQPLTALESNFDVLLASSACIGMVGLWSVWINKSWVRIPAEAYANRLVEACIQLDSQKIDTV